MAKGRRAAFFRQFELDEGKERLDLAETRAEELAGRLGTEWAEREEQKKEADKLARKLAAEKEELQREVEKVHQHIQIERDLTESQISESFLFAKWEKYPKIDYSFFGADAVAAIKKFEEEARAEEPARESVGLSVDQASKDIDPTSLGTTGLSGTEFDNFWIYLLVAKAAAMESSR